MGQVPLLTRKFWEVMNGTRHGYAISLNLLCSHFALFFPICSWKLTSIEVAVYLGSLLTWQQSWCPIYLIQLEMVPSLSGTCYNCPNTLACNPLLGFSKYLLNKEGNTGDSASLCLFLTLLFYFYWFCFSSLMLASLLFHIQNSHIVDQIGQSPFNLG